VRTLDVTIGKLTDVDQPRILQADVHECAEIDHIEHSAFQLHPGSKILEFENPLLEDRLGQVVPRVAFGPAKGFDDVAQGELADIQLLGQLRNVGFGESGL
jgi:hypothetical protein